MSEEIKIPRDDLRNLLARAYIDGFQTKGIGRITHRANRKTEERALAWADHLLRFNKSANPQDTP